MPEDVEACKRSVLEDNPDMDESNAIAICQDMKNRGVLESWLSAEAAPEDHRALAKFMNPQEIRRVEGSGDEVTYKRVMLLSPGMWADAGSKTFVDYNADAIKTSADEWVDLEQIKAEIPDWGEPGKYTNDERAEMLAELGESVALEDAAPVNFLHGEAMYGAKSLEEVGEVPLDSIIIDDDGRMYGDMRLHGESPQSQTVIDLMDEVLEAADSGERAPPPVGPSVEIPADKVDHTGRGLSLERAFFSGVAVVFNPASKPVEIGEQAQHRAIAMSAPGTVDGMDAQGMVYRAVEGPDMVARVRALQARVRRLKRYA